MDCKRTTLFIVYGQPKRPRTKQTVAGLGKAKLHLRATLLPIGPKTDLLHTARAEVSQLVATAKRSWQDNPLPPAKQNS